VSRETDLRVSDAEREAVVSTLGDHHAAGRLTLAELEERVAAAYQSVTRADLRRPLSDLPQPTPAAQPAARGSSGVPWLPWLGTAAVCLTVWVVSSLARGEPGYFWPMWVIAPWGLALIARRVSPGATALGWSGQIPNRRL